MLALKSILSAADAVPTLVFDEVDVGVGGRSGQVVGEKLWGLAAEHQVLVITHLPQVAAFADAHFRVHKSSEEGRAAAGVEPVEGLPPLDEIASTRIDLEQLGDLERTEELIGASGLADA
jgi:DNA repair protein RecN (Recombination protein N)